MIDHHAIHLAVRSHALTLSVASASDSFGRASTATYTDVNGIVQTAAVNVPRTAHYVNGAGPQTLEEGAATNLLTSSEDLSAAAWDSSVLFTRLGLAANSGTAPDGTVTADTIVRAAQRVTLAPLTAYALSFYIKNISATTSEFYLRNVPSDGAGSPVLIHIRLTWSGAVPTANIINGFGTIVTTEALADGWYRVGATCTTPASLDAITDVTFVTGSSVRMWGIELKAEATRSSYVRSAPAAGTRAADLYTLAATATGFTRASGSFLTDGFRVGMEVVPTGFTQTSAATITAVSALTMAVKGGRTIQSANAGRTIAAGLPQLRAFENLSITPVADEPYCEEEYLPGGMTTQTLGNFGSLEATPTYVLRLYGPQRTGMDALRRTADALLTHFAPTTPITVTGHTVRVRSDVAPTPSPLGTTADGWAVITVSIPLRVHTANSR